MENRKIIATVLSAATALTLVAGAICGPLAGTAAYAQRQNDKNNMRNLGVGLGAGAAYEAIKGKGTNALILGAGAALAGKKYEDQRKAQAKDAKATARRRAAYLRAHRRHHD